MYNGAQRRMRGVSSHLEQTGRRFRNERYTYIIEVRVEELTRGLVVREMISFHLKVGVILHGLACG